MKSSKDANHNEIMRELTQAGLSVFSAHKVGEGFPDLVVGGVMPCTCGSKRRVEQNVIIEAKTEKGSLNARQVEFHRFWKGQIAVVRTTQEALRLVGINS